jgi:hypothetical protein
MCLLITAPAGVTIEDEWLRDFYRRNDDGYGFMYAHENKLHILKRLGTVEQFISDWKSLVPYTRAIHLRMRTHGDIDLVNCHPYWVTGYDNDDELPLAMMHNGILSSGNATDTSKSDTWHYINDVLKPLLAKYPHLLQEPTFQQLVEEHIGSGNRFVFLDSLGRMVTLNYGEGVTWEGMWLSNTYAWSAPVDDADDIKYWQGHDYGDAYWRDQNDGYVDSFQVQARETAHQGEELDIVEGGDLTATDDLVYDLCDHLYARGFHRAGNADSLFFKFAGIYGSTSLLRMVERLVGREISEEVFLDDVRGRVELGKELKDLGYDAAGRDAADTTPLFDRSVNYGA